MFPHAFRGCRWCCCCCCCCWITKWKKKKSIGRSSKRSSKEIVLISWSSRILSDNRFEWGMWTLSSLFCRRVSNSFCCLNVQFSIQFFQQKIPQFLPTKEREIKSKSRISIVAPFFWFLLFSFYLFFNVKKEWEWEGMT